jgi:ATP phosphoribosyltransferase
VIDRLGAAGASRRPYGLLVPAKAMASAALDLTAAGLGPVTVSRPDFVFDLTCPPFDELCTVLPQI